ncbi:MAG TPA: ComEA family DNA-binding protein [Candidatus Baltobacteraceae bacterium]|jgi:competence protein ComEA|nr:ComEA family DNA-binding protein [Candidatus Baltobacteraceae bacterium]
MKQTFVIAGLLVVAALALWRPAAPPAPALGESHATAQTPPGRSIPSKDVPRPRASSGAVVYVAGAVLRPGLYQLPPAARADEAVRRAGGFATGADPAGVNLAARIEDGEEIRVPHMGETVKPRSGRRASRKSARTRHVVDVNTADPRALASLPGIGASLAQRIVEYRQLNGPFGSLDELADVSGMTQRRIDSIASYLVVHEAP